MSLISNLNINLRHDINLIGQETHCTIISTDKIYQLSYHDAVFMGELEPVSGTAPYITRTH